MVKILASGEIVQDNDIRAQSHSGGGSSTTRRRQGFIQGDEHRQNEGEAMQGDGLHGQPIAQEGDGPNPVATFIDGLNNRLITAGFPRFNVGPYTVEPIVAVGVIVAGLLLGLPGLLFAVFLFAIVKWSQSGGNVSNFLSGSGETNTERRASRDDGQHGAQAQRRSSRRSDQQAGHRLGRS